MAFVLRRRHLGVTWEYCSVQQVVQREPKKFYGDGKIIFREALEERLSNRQPDTHHQLRSPLGTQWETSPRPYHFY
jgi:hypothetical protein